MPAQHTVPFPQASPVSQHCTFVRMQTPPQGLYFAGQQLSVFLQTKPQQTSPAWQALPLQQTRVAG